MFIFLSGILWADLLFHCRKKRRKKSITPTSSCQIKHHKNKRAVWKVFIFCCFEDRCSENMALHRSGSSIHCSCSGRQHEQTEKDGWRRRGEDRWRGEEEVVVVIAGMQGRGVGGALKSVLLILPSILDPRKLKRCQNEGWSLFRGSPTVNTLPHPSHYTSRLHIQSLHHGWGQF